MIHEDFNGAAPRFYAKFVRTIPSRDDLTGQMMTALGDLPSEAHIVEVGMGNGSLTEQIFQTYPMVGRYTGIEPSQAMVEAIPTSLLHDRRFSAECVGFEDWEGHASTIDVVVCRYVIHDFPNLLEDWYGKISRVLKPGGRFVSLDISLADDPTQTQTNVDGVIGRALSVVCKDADELLAQERFVQHLRQEIHRYRPLEEHLAILRAAGLEPRVLARAGNNYLLEATKTRSDWD